MKDNNLVKYIYALRVGLGLSQFQLATFVGVSDKAASKQENGDTDPIILLLIMILGMYFERS